MYEHGVTGIRVHFLMSEYLNLLHQVTAGHPSLQPTDNMSYPNEEYMSSVYMMLECVPSHHSFFCNQ